MNASLFIFGERPTWAAPRSVNEMFRLFSVYDPAVGLDSLLDRLDYTGVSRAQVYKSVLNRTPDDSQSHHTDAYEPRTHFAVGLNSSEFQSRIIDLISAAFQEKDRLIFVHIPKCAGTDLVVNLSNTCVPVRTSLADPNWTSKEQLFAHLMRIALDLQFTQRILIAGHIKLRWLLDKNLRRPADRVFTVLRDPIDIAISQANYIASRLRTLPPTAPDVRDWLAILGLDTVPAVNPDDLAMMVLRSRALVPGNTMCMQLGSGDLVSALANLSEGHLEVSEAARYNRWRREVWGILSESQHNSSPQIIRRGHLDTATLNYLQDISEQDRALYRKVCASMSGSSWVCGTHIQ